jgi:fructuronate reductase
MGAGLPGELPRLGRSGATKQKIGIVHLGLGAFFRAHGAMYVREAMELSGGDWGIVGVSLRNPDQREKLAPQDFVYTSVSLGPGGNKASIVEVINDVLVAQENPQAVLEIMASPAIRLVTLTVTEKGYCHIPALNRLNLEHPDIEHDLANPGSPMSAPGYIVEALARRRIAGLKPFTVLSCDNLPENGVASRNVIVSLAREKDSDLAEWIETEGAFPSSMVDRIVPATTSDDIALVGKLTGRMDLSPVMHEPFRQWVIEDEFVDNERPDLAAAGARMVRDVKPFELMKLRCLNGTHSSLAYLGYLCGFETISETVADTPFAAYLRYLWDCEIIPSFTPPENTDLNAYTAELLRRYENKSIRHRTWQIARDGSQKLPQRLLGTVSDNLANGHPIRGLALAIAGWIRYVCGTDEKGSEIDVRDPLAGIFKMIAGTQRSPAGIVEAFLEIDNVFPAGLVTNATFRNELTSAFDAIVSKGARNCVMGIVT